MTTPTLAAIPSSIYVLLGWIGGIAATVIGSWIASKIRIYQDERKSHRDDLKERILIPLHDGLEKHFRPLVFGLEPLVFVQTAAPTEFREDAKATESQIEQGDVLQGEFPSSLVFGLLDSALLHDARRTHFKKELGDVDNFLTTFLIPAGECHAWVRRMAHTILTESGLPAFPSKATSVRGPAPYVMHYRLAVFVYKRLFRFSAPALRTSNMNDGANWTLNGEDATLALGTEEQISALLAHINKLREAEKGQAELLHGRFASLEKDFQELMPKLSYAIAVRRLRHRCDLVTFF